jgi:hypothetical protein
MSFNGLVELRHAFDSRTWPHVNGKIVHSKTERVRRVDGPESTVGIVEYKYVIDGSTLTSRQVALGGGEEVRYDMNAVLARYPSGSEVSVYYYPPDPRLSVLEVGVNAKLFLDRLGFAIAFSLVGFLGLCFGSKIKWQSK